MKSKIQIFPKLGRILKFKPQQCYKLLKSLLQTENEGRLGFELWPRFARFFCAFALKQQQLRLRKRHLKNKVALLQTLSRLFHHVQFAKCWHFFSLELSFKRLYRGSGKEKEKPCLVFTSLQKVKLGLFMS